MGKTVRFLLVQGPLLPRCDSNTRDQARSRPIGGSERLQARLGYTPPSPVCGLGQAFQGRLAPMATRPKADELSNRVATLEKRVSELANQLADHTASLPPFLLVGWVQISTYCQRSPRTISRYANGLGFPVIRWGRHVACSPYAIDRWLCAFQKAKARKDAVSASSDDQLKARQRELNRALKR